MYDERQVGGRHAQQREGHLAPLHAAPDVAVYLSPAVHPEALVDAGLRIVVVIVASEHVLQPKRVADGEHRGVEVYLQSALLGVDVGLARGKAQLSAQLGGTELGVGSGGHRPEIQVAAGLVLFGLHRHRGLEAPVFLALEGQFLPVVEHHLVHLRPFQRRKHIVLVRVHELV